MVLWDFNICYFVWNGIFVKFQFVVQTPLHIRWYYGMSVSAISFGMDFCEISVCGPDTFTF